MAIKEVKSGDRYNTMPKEFWMDSDEDVINLPIDAPVFSLAVSTSGNVYVLGSDQKWKIFGGES